LAGEGGPFQGGAWSSSGPLTLCPLCKGPDDIEVRTAAGTDVNRVTCRRCGTFEIDGDAWALFPPEVVRPGLDRHRYLLSGRARNATLGGRVEGFHLNDFGAAADGNLREPDLNEKMRLILAWFQRRSTRFGEILLQVSEIDYPVGYCRDPHEWMALIHAMVDEKWLATDHTGFGVTLAGRGKLRERPAVEVAEPADYWSTYPEANLDALTKLIVRGRFDIDLERSFTEASEISPAALLFVDIDHFKKINDEHGGHAEGDRVLRGVAEMFRSAVGRRGLVYRYGGEEIVVILPGFSESEAAAVAERLRESVEGVDWHLVPPRSVTVSIGVARVPDGKIISPALFCQHADQAMYSAKKNGRNRVALASRGVDYPLRQPAP
jgi:diguanylate cyclase (GGDEF)-like protein